MNLFTLLCSYLNTVCAVIFLWFTYIYGFHGLGALGKVYTCKNLDLKISIGLLYNGKTWPSVNMITLKSNIRESFILRKLKRVW